MVLPEQHSTQIPVSLWTNTCPRKTHFFVTDITHHQTDNATSPANNHTSRLISSLGRKGLLNRTAAFLPTNQNSPVGLLGRRPVRERSVHFEGPELSPDSEYQSTAPLWHASPTPATPRPVGAPYFMPQHNVPVYQPPEWTSTAHAQPPEWASAAHVQPIEDIYYDEPHEKPQSIYNQPFTDRGSLLNLVRSLHDIVLLGLPLLYHRRLARVREKADLPQPVITWATNPAASYPFLPYRKRTLLADIQPQLTGVRQQTALGGHSKGTRVQWDGFRAEWESFVFASTQEWQTLNIISALLLRYASLVTDPLYRASGQSY